MQYIPLFFRETKFHENFRENDFTEKKYFQHKKYGE